MTPELPPEPEPQPKGLGEGSRLTGVFFEPAKTFEDVAARPRLWAPLLLVVAVALCYIGLYGQAVGWERTVRHQIEAGSQAAQLPADQLEQRIQMGVKIAPIFGYGGVLLGVPLVT